MAQRQHFIVLKNTWYMWKNGTSTVPLQQDIKLIRREYILLQMIINCWRKLKISKQDAGFILHNSFIHIVCIFMHSICDNRYPQYEFISDKTISQFAGQDKRNSIDSLYGIIFDITMLSESDYLVCTFSSQVRSPFIE